MNIYTSYYGNVKKLQKAGITPVAISVQVPKWFNGQSIKELAPTYSMLRLSKDVYELKFRDILNKVSTADIIKELREIGDGGDVALLCYESLHKEGEWCHRTMVANWLEANGIKVQEFIG